MMSNEIKGLDIENLEVDVAPTGTGGAVIIEIAIIYYATEHRQNQR